MASVFGKLMEFFDLSVEVEVEKEKEISNNDNNNNNNVIMETINWGLPIPQHISQVIFSKLPISKLPVFTLVSKSWNHLILDYASSSSKFFPKTFLFSTSQLDHNHNVHYNPTIHRLDCDTFDSLFEFGFPHDYENRLIIANHCNGLLFFSKHGKYHNRVCMGILNPLTTELLEFPIFDDTFVHGFGFSPRTKQYKLFRLVPKGTSYGVEIFRFGRGDQWRPTRLPDFPLNICSHGTYLDGVVYWIGREIGNENVIYALDVETEKFALSGRISEVGSYSWSGWLQALNGTIYAIIHLSVTPTCPRFQIWRMRKKDCWTYACSFQPFINVDYDKFNNICMVKSSQDGEIMWFLHGNYLFCLDKCGKMIERKTLVPNGDIYVQYAWPIEFLQFGSLSNILAGVDDYTAYTPFHFI